MMPPGSYWPRGTCEECGILPPPDKHERCHECGHLLSRHSDHLRCRICNRLCGQNPAPWPRDPDGAAMREWRDGNGQRQLPGYEAVAWKQLQIPSDMGARTK